MRNRLLLDVVSKLLHLIRFRIVFRPWRQRRPARIARLGELCPISCHKVDPPPIVRSNFAPTAGPKPSCEEAGFKAVERAQPGIGLGPAGVGEIVVPNFLPASCRIPCETMRWISKGVVGIEAGKCV